MSNDDSRGNESPDRQDASLPQTPTQPIRTYLEALDTLTRALHARLHLAEIEGERVPDETRRKARRRCREIRAEASGIGLSLLGPDAAIPYHPDETDADTGSGVTTFSGPPPSKFGREHQHDHEPEQNREPDDEDANDEDTDNGERDD
ncbi:hypothetical protein [Natronorubrum texcoconense]|uniref:Uncharacterized protein n=1 Tax=Natronorubrum texcoconense TaxID=1095776 RepID=A0A1G8VPW2_9EURY|nr:hypothetical protein [Natronorubrum texcoconense]SDJ67979.1 hypothetical protein SAMN04515672_1443 [Natronorubrum texcoconense]